MFKKIKPGITIASDSGAAQIITRCLSLAVLPVIALLPALAYAQNNAASQQDTAGLEEVVITGSRIQKSNLVSSSPVTQIDSEELVFQGTVRVEDLMRSMPQVYTTQNTGQSNGATGTATLDLRKLGDERTLVLVNGRRLPAGSPIQGGIGADINQIPGALIKRVEVLTGGSSATYGSDAVAGVVNFIMMDDFQGFKLDYQFSQFQHDNDNKGVQRIVRNSGFPVADGSVRDGDMETFSLIIGGNIDGGRGNITAYATYRNIDPVLQSSRDYSSCTLSGDLTACSGSPTIPDGRVTDFGTADPDGVIDGFDFKVLGNEFVDAAGATYNFGALNYYQRPDERYTFGSFARYDINDNIEVYSELMFMDNRTVSQIAPSGAFFVTDSISCGNPFLSTQQFQALCGDFGLTTDDTQYAFLGRRNVEGGPRQQDLRHTSFRGNLGFRGDINDTWRYDFYGQFSEVSMENTYLNDLSTTKIKRALNAVADPTTGETVCQSVVDGSDPSCVPWNIFKTGAVTQEMIDYLVLPLFARGTTDQAIFSGYIAGKLGDYGIQSPAADTGIDIVIGFEHREENLNFNPDNGFRSGDGAGQGGAVGPVNGGYSVEEFFFETSIPLVENKPFARELTLDLGYRSSDYSTGPQNDTFGIRSGWAINDSIKLRGSFQRAIRAANIQELFLPQGLNLFDMDADPCGGPVTDGRTAAGRTFEECARSGVTAAQFGNVSSNPAGQYNFLQGGVPELTPEKADTYSFGFIWSPEFVEDLTISIDYYNIEITDGIDNLTPDGILNRCLDGNAAQCSLVNRSARGDLWIGSDLSSSGFVTALNDNLATEEVEGFDIVIDYALDLGTLGRLKFNNVTAYIETWDKQELKGAPIVDCKGTWGQSCEDPTPDLQNNLRVTWDTPWEVTASVMWRYISEVEDLNANEIDLDEVSYIDLSAVWGVTDYATLRLGVNNVFDEEPPLAGTTAGSSINGNGNIFPGVYDALGRYLFAGVTLSF